ncbi:MAG TPA: hypothetical protein PK999_05245, partial [Nitrospira sp.]|nr:hypothetical protein [Nitrospira sp.]
GSTVDHILQNNFGRQWLAFDGAQASSRIPPEQLVSFLRDHPEARAVSSHNLTLPVPAMEGIDLAPILFLRHPLDRVRSIYDFERRQGLLHGPVSRGAEHAAKLDFDGYVNWRFDMSRNGVIHNYHTAWLLHHPRYNRVAIRQGDYEAALGTLSALPFFGLVEQFDASLALLDGVLASLGVSLSLDYRAQNTSQHHEKPLSKRIATLQESICKTTWARLEERNAWDLRLYEQARSLFEQRLAAPAPNAWTSARATTWGHRV